MKNRIVVMGILLGVLSMPSHGAWSTSLSKDEMTDEKSAYATSPAVAPTERMRFPYSDTKAWMGVGCDSKNEWSYFGFSSAPNLNHTSIEDGYHRIQTRIKWDSKVENVTLIQEWGAAFIHFRNNQSAIENITKSTSLLLELNWHGNGKTYFRFSLEGSSAALKNIREVCAHGG